MGNSKQLELRKLENNLKGLIEKAWFIPESRTAEQEAQMADIRRRILAVTQQIIKDKEDANQ